MYIKKLLAVTLVCIFAVSFVVGDTVYLNKEKEELFIAQNGMKIGEINSSAPIEVIRDKEEWLQVNVRAWIKKKAVRVSRNVEEEIISVVSFDKKSELGEYDVYTREYDRKMYLSMEYKNNGDRTITDWEGLLSVKNLAGELIFRLNVISSITIIKPGAVEQLTIELNRNKFRNKGAFDFFDKAKNDHIVLELSEIAIKTKK